MLSLTDQATVGDGRGFVAESGEMKKQATLILMGAVLGVQARSRGAVVYDVPAGNTGQMNNSIVWNSVGAFGSGGGVVIGPSQFISVAHVSGAPGPFSLVTTVGGVTTTNSYSAIASTGIPGTDLTVWTISGTFPTTSIAPLYTGTAGGLTNAPLYLVGNGYFTQGAAITTNSVMNGWYWAGTKTKNYSQNTVDGTVVMNGGNGLGTPSLDFLFQPETGVNEGIYTSGDSGGGAFVYNSAAGEYQLAGIADNIAPDYYQETSPGVYTLLSDGHAGTGVFDAAIYNATNLYVQTGPTTYVLADSEGLQNEVGIADDLQPYYGQIEALVPEPGTLALGVGGAMLLLWRRRPAGKPS
jgi:hypothetical protein